MELTKENYYSVEANKEYWSASLCKQMCECPAMAIAEADGLYVRPESTALMVGQYVDSYFEGTMDAFMALNGDKVINKRTGELKADYRLADSMIQRASKDKVFMDFMEGEKQTIFTGEIDGVKFKSKFDVYQPGKRIVDLKTVRDFEPLYRKGEGRLSFAEYWRWPLQMAIYQELEGNHLPCYLAVITKQEPADICVIEIPQNVLDAELALLKQKLPKWEAMRMGVMPVEHCCKCDYCRGTHILTGPISLDEFNEGEDK